MTVSTEVSREEYTGNGVTTDFDYRFRVFSADELVVTVADITENIRTLVMNTDYTVTGAGSRNGGKVKLVSALASNWRISIERELPVTQETDIRNQGNFFPEVHEDAWDKLTMLIQQAIGGLGLALRKPNWLAKYYDAKGNRIANMADPVASQDAATKGYVDSVGDGLFKKTLRFPENVEAMPPASSRGHSLQGYTAEGRPVPVFSMTDTADLALKLASNSGAGLVGFDPRKKYISSTVGKFISNMFDEGQQLQYWYDLTGNWDDAWRQAQLAVYLHGFSPKIVFPSKQIVLRKPLIHGTALGDWIHQNYPELDFYNPETGKYKAIWPCNIQGVYRKHQGGAKDIYNGTQLVFSGCLDSTDRTWMNYGVVHCGPTEVEQFRQTATVKKFWPGYCVVKDVNIRGLNKNAVGLPLVHGIVIFNGTQCVIENVSSYQVYGAGICMDWTWDSRIENCIFMQCGRMSPDFRQCISDGNVSEKYQTYAPIHIMASPSNGDNSNFIRVKNTHIEDCYYANADVIASGNASPIYLEDLHMETDTSTGISKLSLKTRISSGRGVRYFGQDSEVGFDYTKIRGEVGSGGYFVWRGGATYAAGYSSLAIIERYSALILSDLRVPNSGDIYLRSGNSSSYVIAQNCTLGSVYAIGGNSHPNPVILDNCDCQDVIADYVFSMRLNNVRGRNLLITNPYNNKSMPWLLNATFNKVEGVIRYGSGKIVLYSETESSSLLVTHGDLEISNYAWYMKDIGAVE